MVGTLNLTPEHPSTIDLLGGLKLIVQATQGQLSLSVEDPKRPNSDGSGALLFYQETSLNVGSEGIEGLIKKNLFEFGNYAVTCIKNHD